MKVIVAFVLFFFCSFAFPHEVEEEFFEHDQKQFELLKKETPSVENTPNILADWQKILAHTPALKGAQLYVSPDMELGRAFSNNSIVVTPELEKFPSAYRFFILLHEAGHLVKRHDDALVKLFIRLDVKNNKNVKFSQVTVVTHVLEFEADAYAIKRMYDFGYNVSEVWPLFEEFGRSVPGDTISHPSPQRRIDAMKSIDF